MAEEEKTKYKEVTVREPKLDSEEKLYVRAFLHSMSHPKAYRVLHPDTKGNQTNNKYAKRANVQYHISKSLQTRMESLDLSESSIIEKMYHEATYMGYGTNHNARILALTTLGKHLGLFNENQKEEKQGVTYNIINYEDKNTKSKTELLVKPAPPESAISIPKEIPGLKITNYRETDNDNSKTERTQS